MSGGSGASRAALEGARRPGVRHSPPRVPPTASPAAGRRLLMCACVAVLTGCASLSGPPATEGPVDVWRGRFALMVEPSPQAPDGQRSTGRFVLTHTPSFTELELVSPLGNTLAAARSDAQGATLKTADGKRWNAASTDELTEQLFGWRIPITRLAPWLHGRLETVTETGEPLSDGRLRPLAGTEQGWQLRYEAWADDAPQRLTVVYPGRVNLRLIVDEH